MKNKLANFFTGSSQESETVDILSIFSTYGSTEVGDRLKALMRDHYTVDNLSNISEDEFEARIQAFLNNDDVVDEGYQDAEYQRDLSVDFTWGHNHDFGAFNLEGKMGNRHIDILATFFQEYGLEPDFFDGKSVLDIGCWTGGTSLLLAALGAEVTAVEEVRKYGQCVEYLTHAFGLERISIVPESLFALDKPEFYDRFDVVLYPGVLYHVTDPVLSLRILFNTLKDGGVCLVETAGIPAKDNICEYQGATFTYSKPGTMRSGWNWFLPSTESLSLMMQDVGFEVRKSTFHRANRALALGVREEHKDMLRAGLSKPHVR